MKREYISPVNSILELDEADLIADSISTGDDADDPKKEIEGDAKQQTPFGRGGSIWDNEW